MINEASLVKSLQFPSIFLNDTWWILKPLENSPCSVFLIWTVWREGCRTYWVLTCKYHPFVGSDTQENEKQLLSWTSKREEEALLPKQQVSWFLDVFST